MLSKKENYYRLLEGKMPEYVPVFDMMPIRAWSRPPS